MTEVEDFSSYYSSKVTVAGIEFDVDEQGYVRTKKFGSLGHLSEIVSSGCTLNEVFEVLEEIEAEPQKSTSLEPKN